MTARLFLLDTNILIGALNGHAAVRRRLDNVGEFQRVPALEIENWLDPA